MWSNDQFNRHNQNRRSASSKLGSIETNLRMARVIKPSKRKETALGIYRLTVRNVIAWAMNFMIWIVPSVRQHFCMGGKKNQTPATSFLKKSRAFMSLNVFLLRCPSGLVCGTVFFIPRHLWHPPDNLKRAASVPRFGECRIKMVEWESAIWMILLG